jgi:hypothetical protein
MYYGHRLISSALFFSLFKDETKALGNNKSEIKKELTFLMTAYCIFERVIGKIILEKLKTSVMENKHILRRKNEHYKSVVQTSPRNRAVVRNLDSPQRNLSRKKMIQIDQKLYLYIIPDPLIVLND